MIRFLILVLMVLSVGTATAAGQQASPSAEVPCTVEPRAVDDMVNLWFDLAGTPHAAEPGDARVAEWALDRTQGEPADAPIADTIESVAREWVTCTNAGDQRRAHALLTDAYAHQRGPLGTTRDATQAALAAPPTPRSTDAALSIGPPIDVRTFPDGQVGATFAVTGIQEPGEALAVFIQFVQVDGQWRIDGMIGLLAPPPTAPVWRWRVLAEYPHYSDAYTQGLMLIDGVLYEGTGLEGQSELRQVDLETGTVVQSHALADEHFGEGIVVLGDRIYQITFQSGIAFVYDRETFDQLQTFGYDGEGWGLTTDAERLIMSDGSDRLFIRDAETFAVLETVRVQDAGLPVSALNELEYVNGEVWANVYQTDWIVRIDPESGNVVGWVDMRGLRPTDDPQWENAGVLNGIAWDPSSGRLLVTGKNWPRLYEIELVPPE